MKKVILAIIALAMLLTMLAPIAQAESVEETAKKIGEIFGRFQDARPPTAAHPYLRRPVFLKPHGCMKATFVPLAVLPKKLAKGVFALGNTRDAWVRISSDTVPSSSDKENKTVGIAIKVLDVPGRKILKGEEGGTTHDFLLQNHPVFFSDTAKDFLEFMEAIMQGEEAEKHYLDKNLVTKQILDDMKKPVASALSTTYWSGVPSMLGKSLVKYRLIPLMPPKTVPIPDGEDQPNYLRDRLATDVRKWGGRFELQVQFAPPGANPEKPTEYWDEEKHKPQTVAYVVIHHGQNIADNELACERMSFTAWHALPEHRPVGSIQKARGIVYKMMADKRLNSTTQIGGAGSN